MVSCKRNQPDHVSSAGFILNGDFFNSFVGTHCSAQRIGLLILTYQC